MKCVCSLACLCLLLAAGGSASAEETLPLGLPPVPVKADNPQTVAKINLGKRLFEDSRFSTTGKVSCATCHASEKTFTDSPLRVSKGIKDLTGTRNSPTVVNSAYFEKLFWDGRSPDLEDQALHPFVNPVEMGLKDHNPILRIIRKDREYREAFREVFDLDAEKITMKEVTQAIAAFERTVVSGNSPFDRYQYGGDKSAMTEQQVRGLGVFLDEGRCVSCHVIENDQALFTDNRFHNIGIGINEIQSDVPGIASAFLKAKARGSNVDVKVLTDPKSSELGRFAVTSGLNDLGAFKTPTLRNVAVTAPYMHDGSLETLEEVVIHYMNGGVTNAGEEVNYYLSGGIRPLDLTDEQVDDLVAFMEALTSPEFAAKAKSQGDTGSKKEEGR